MLYHIGTLELCLANNSDHNFLLYGDNFLECERFVDEVLCDPNSKLQFKQEDGKYLDRPILVFQDTETGDKLRFHLRPRFAAWKSDTSRKYSHENLDVFLFQIKDGKQLPILAVEYDDATQAGNQAWQRGNRAADTAQKKIPYMYVIPEETKEYNDDGTVKSSRVPAYFIPLSHISLSCGSKQISLLITHNIKTAKELEKKVATILSYLIRCTYRINIEKPYKELADLYGKILSYTEVCTGWDKEHIWKNHPIMKKTMRELNAKEISTAILDGKEIPKEIDLSKINSDDFNSGNFLPYTKIITKKTAERKKFWTDVYNKLVCPKNNLAQYQKVWGKEEFNRPAMPIGFGDYQSAVIMNKTILKCVLVEAYPAIRTDITQFINSVKGPVGFHLLAGYKNTETGGTSRPDTGYLATMWSLFPTLFQKKNSIVIIYSNGVPADWQARQDKGDNEFWKSVSNYTGYVIVDRYQNGKKN